MTRAQFRRSSPKITICEKLREINDLHQTNTDHDIEVRKLLVETQVLAKKMSKKLLDYNVDVFKNFWEKNPDYLKSLRKRIDCDYLAGNDSIPNEKELRIFAGKIDSWENHGNQIADYIIDIVPKLQKNQCIVEVWPWFGQVTACLSLGIKKYRRQDLDIHCFDSWKATKHDCERLKNHDNIRIKPGDRLYHYFEDNICPFNQNITNHCIDNVNKIQWLGMPITLFIFRSGTSVKTIKRIFKIFEPFFQINKTIILWTDYYFSFDEKEKNETMKWREKVVEKSNGLRFLKRVKNSKMAVFKYTKGKIIYG